MTSKKTVEHEGKKVRIVEATPKWTTVMPLLMYGLRRGDNTQEQAAREEILRLAKAYDELEPAYNELVDYVNYCESAINKAVIPLPFDKWNVPATKEYYKKLQSLNNEH